jgi:hypothetical protein
MHALDSELDQTDFFEIVVQTISLCIDSNSCGGVNPLVQLFKGTLGVHVDEIALQL